MHATSLRLASDGWCAFRGVATGRGGFRLTTALAFWRKGYRTELAKANNVRLDCRGLLNNVFENIDVIGCPTMTTPPFPITLEEMYGAMFLLDDPNWGRFTVPFDFSGAPTISLPCGQTSDGLPLSIQFVGKHLSEPLQCRLGHTFEQTTQWHNLRPILPLDPERSEALAYLPSPTILPQMKPERDLEGELNEV